MKTQIATTQDQSSRLLRCGVPADTADMMWSRLDETRDHSLYAIPWYTPRLPNRKITDNNFPAWSLGALLGFLPKTISDFWMTKWYDPTADGFVICDKKTPYLLSGDFQLLHIGDGKYQVEYDWNGFQGRLSQSDNPIEACVLAIELLAANGYNLNGIEKGGEK